MKSTGLLGFNSMQFRENRNFAVASGSLRTTWLYNPEYVLFNNTVLGATAGNLLQPLK
jgi:hypothetical protein